MLDSNAFDEILDTSGILEFLSDLWARGLIVIITTHVQLDELSATPDSKRERRDGLVDVYDRLTKTALPTAAAIWDISKWDEASWGNGGGALRIEDTMRANSRDAEDALVVAAFVLLNHGPMTAENQQFPDFFLALRNTFRALQILVLDGANYDQDLSAEAQRYNVLLLAPQKKGADPSNALAGREMMEFNLWLQKNTVEVWEFFYRWRSNIEGIFSANKRTDGQGIALRPRASESKFEIEYPPGKKMTGMSKAQKKEFEQRQLMAARSKVSIAHKAEIRARILGHNLRATVRLERLQDVEIDYRLTLAEATGIDVKPADSKRGTFDPTCLHA